MAQLVPVVAGGYAGGIIEYLRLFIEGRSALFIGREEVSRFFLPQLLKQTVEELRKIPEIVEAHFITGKGNILVKLYCVDNEHLMRTIFDGILRIRGIATTETNISLQEVFQREVNIDFIDE